MLNGQPDHTAYKQHGCVCSRRLHDECAHRLPDIFRQTHTECRLTCADVDGEVVVTEVNEESAAADADVSALTLRLKHAVKLGNN